ncbi:hypothetical protein SAY87_006558 [Trapa incisa]|uniref:Major pollen allergen Ole e 6-like n=2 Tax=Trapa TaxID=22665 RepID=A0AAN7L055_TRANT|nr:hypothetical protein SAY87_006558 [Trapa incisa]KAK4775374.1 hypothetical protein SAY86_010309 [Trapa natans]
MAFNKLVAVFLVFIFFGATLNADRAIAATDEKYKSCFDTCIGECMTGQQGYTFCEMKCDEDCSEKEIMDKLKSRFN